MRRPVLGAILFLLAAVGCENNVTGPTQDVQHAPLAPKPLPEVKEFVWGRGKIALGMTKAEVLDQIERTWERPADDPFQAQGMKVPGVPVPSEKIQKSDRWVLSYGVGSGAAPGGGGLTFVFERGRLIRIIVGPSFA